MLVDLEGCRQPRLLGSFILPTSALELEHLPSKTPGSAWVWLPALLSHLLLLRVAVPAPFPTERKTFPLLNTGIVPHPAPAWIPACCTGFLLLGFAQVLCRFCTGFVQLSTLSAAGEFPCLKDVAERKFQLSARSKEPVRMQGYPVLVWILPNLHLHVPPIKIFPPKSFWVLVVLVLFSSVKCLKLGIFQGKGIPTHHQSLSCLLWNIEIPKFSAAALLSLCLFFLSCQELNLEGTKHSCEWKWCTRLEE